MKVEKASLSDVDDLREIGIDSYIPYYTLLWKEGGLEWYMNRCFATENLEGELKDSNIEYYLIKNNSQKIGILKLVLKKPIPDSDFNNALYLEKIYFIKEFLGKGVGRKAIEFTFQRAKELKRDCVWLMAMDTADKPISAYKKSGFSVFSQTRLSFEFMKEEFRGMVIMKHCFNNNE